METTARISMYDEFVVVIIEPKFGCKMSSHRPSLCRMSVAVCARVALLENRLVIMIILTHDKASILTHDI